MGAEPKLSLGVLICTYQRPDALARCLDGLTALHRRPDDVIVVCRSSDLVTRAMLAEHSFGTLPLRVVTVAKPGIVAARNAGHDACRTDVIASIDDDVVPHPEWLGRVEDHFLSDPQLGGLGGRDHVHDGTAFDEGKAGPVGRLQWFGRTIGNHHLGFGDPRQVQILKGANMSYRAAAIGTVRFDQRLCGRKIEAHEDLAFSAAVGRKGWKLLYDPAVLVYHYAGRSDPRAYSAISKGVPLGDVRDAAFNKVIALWDNLSRPGRVAFIAWSLLVGTGIEPGLLQAVRYTGRLGISAWTRFIATQKGRFSAYWALLADTPTTAGTSPAAVRQGAPGNR